MNERKPRLCVVCHQTPEYPLCGGRCMDCWGEEATYWKWRGERPLEIRQRRTRELALERER